MIHYTDLAFRYIKMKKTRSVLTALGVSISVMILYIVLNLGWSYVLNERADIRSLHDYEIVLLTDNGEQIERISSDSRVKDVTLGAYYDYDYESPIVYENAMYINTVNPYRMNNTLSELMTEYGVEGELNDVLAQLYLQGSDGEQMRVIILVYFFISYIFAIFGVGIIRNSIQLTLFEQVKDFGNLRCIGSTKKQMQAVIYIQGAVLELLGIILGTLLGSVGSVVGGELIGWKNTGFHLLPMVFVLLAFLLDLYFAMKENAKLVTGMSPISAIRGEYRVHLGKKKKIVLQEFLKKGISFSKKSDKSNLDEKDQNIIKTDKKSRKTKSGKLKGRKISLFGRLIIRLFGVEGDYAYKNIMRSPGRFFKMVTAMTFGVAAVIILSCGMIALIDYDRKWQDYYGYYPIYVTWYTDIMCEWADTVSRVPFTKLNEEISNLTNLTEAKMVYVDEMLVADEDDLFSHFSDEYYTKGRLIEERRNNKSEFAEGEGVQNNDKEMWVRSNLLYDNAVNVVGYDEGDMARLKEHLVAGTLDVSDEGVVIVADDYMWVHDDRYSIDEYMVYLKHEHLLDYKLGDTISLLDMTQYRKRYHERVDDAEKEFETTADDILEEIEKAENEGDMVKALKLEHKKQKYRDAFYTLQYKTIVEVYDELKTEGLYKTYRIEGILDRNAISRAAAEDPIPMVIVPKERFHDVTGREEDYFSGMMYHFDPFTLKQYEQVDWYNWQGDNEKDGYTVSAYDGYFMSSYPDWEYAKRALKKRIIAAVLISMFLVSMVVINYINNTSSNIYMRRREFAQLRVIGVSKKGLFKLVMMEGIIIAIISCVTGTALGAGISYGIIMFIFRYYKDVEFVFPWIPAILSIIVSVLILGGAAYIPLKKMGNDVAADLATAGE